MTETAPSPVSWRIVRLQRKPKEGRGRGIPKRPVDELVISADGVEGDFNRWRTEKAAGDPDQAVLLLAEEILAELRTEGWPVAPGDLGENLLVAGLPPDGLAPGAQVRAGEVELEISKPCDPCVVLYGLPYVGIERGPAFVRTLRGRRGWFARVVRGGVLRVGMEIVCHPERSEGPSRSRLDSPPHSTMPQRAPGSTHPPAGVSRSASAGPQVP